MIQYSVLNVTKCIKCFLLHRGILNSLGMFGNSAVGARAAAAIMFIIGLMFGLAAAVNMIILLKVSYLRFNFICIDNVLFAIIVSTRPESPDFFRFFFQAWKVLEANLFPCKYL